MVVASPLNLKKVTTSASDSQKKVTEARSSVKNIGQVILKRTKVKRESFAQTNLFRKRREENEKRMMLEDELEAPRVAISLNGPQKLIQATGVGGFFNRILGFIGYLSAGWLMNNLPTLIAMGKEFVARIQKAGEILSGFFNNTIRLFFNVGNILGALGQNLLQFDFFDTSNRVKTAMGDLNFTMENLTSQIEEAFGLLTTPLTEGKYSGEQIPETGTQRTDEGAYATPPPYSGPSPSTGNITNTQKQALNILSKYESAGSGGYDAVNQIGIRGGRGVMGYSGDFKKMPQHGGRSLTDMTIAEIMSLQAPRSGMSNQEWIRQGRLHAVGRYQFIGMTLPGVVKRSGIPITAKFTPEVQDLLALQYLKEAGIGAWVGPADKATRQERAIIEAARKEPINYRPPVSTSSSPQPRQNLPVRGRFTPLTGTSGNSMGNRPLSTPTSPFLGKAGPITSGFGYRWGRMHRGYDIGVPTGTPVYAYLPGVVTRIGYDPYGYGHYIEWKDSIHNQFHFFGHLKQKPSLREGQSFESGAPLGLTGSTGRSTAPHLHWEIGPQGSQVDPGKWLKGIGSKQLPVSPTASQISAPPQQTNMVPLSLAPERKGQDIMIIEPQQQQNIITPASGGGDMLPSPISDFQLLNNFIKNKLLLDLAYV
jgi:murein DD-endopeptidase MepM/ murein hydrolase activator NlpD